MSFRSSAQVIKKARTIVMWLVLLCMGFSASSLSAGENITLAANDAINILAAHNQMNALNSDKSKSSQIGLAVEMGGLEGASVGITGGKSRSKNNSISKEQIWSYSTITAGENVNLISGGDTNIIGAHLDAETINASVGNDLNIASPQNTSKHLEFGESSTTKFAIGPQVMVGGKKDKNSQIARSEHINSTTLNADSINLSAQKDINITAANVVATDDLNLLSHAGNIAISAGKTTDTGLQSNSSTRLGPLPSEGGISSTVGIDKLTQNSFEASEQAIGSTVGSLGGNVNIMAKEGNYTQTGSDVIALKGDINILAQEITIKEAQESTRLFQTMQQSRLGITTGVSSPIISLIQQIERLAENAENTEDDRTRALAVGAAGLSIYNNRVDLANAVGVNGVSGVKAGLASIKVSVSVGSSKSQSQEMEYSQTASSSNVSAAGNVNLVATGKDGVGSTPEVPVKTGGNITIQGSNVTAGNDATLIANDKINILAAYNVQGEAFKEKSSSASVGVGVSIGQQTGFGIDLAGSGAKGHRIEADQSWTYSHVKAGNTTTLISGGDTNIIGGQVIGNRVQADIGGDLNIQSLQNTSKGEAKDKSTGASISIGWGTYTSIGEGIASAAASANQSKANANGEYASVVEYAGIMAGSGGFQVNVKGNTDLKGAIISSTQAAIDQGKNELTTGSLTTSDILNVNKSESKGSSIGLGVSKGGKDADGQEKGFGASPPLPLSGKKDDEEYSITLSGISGGKITITDEGKQLQLTGQTAQEAIDGINTDVLTGMATGGLIKDWDVEKQLKEMQANIDITKEFVQEGGQFVSGLGIREKEKKDDAVKKLENPNLSPEDRARYEEIAYGKTLWQMGDGGRLIATSLLAALSGNVSGSNADILQGAAINAIQGLGAQQIKALIDGLGEDKTIAGEGMRAALQALLACGGAAAQGGSCSAGALGAGSAVVVGNLIEKLKNTDVTKLTPEEKEAHLNLVNTIVGVITLGVGEDVQVAITAATLEMENNRLAWNRAPEKRVIERYINQLGYSEEDVFAVSCALTKCSEGIKDEKLKTYFMSQELLGLSEENRELLAKLGKEKGTTDVTDFGLSDDNPYPLFTYIDGDQFLDEYQVALRAGKLTQALGGLGSMGVGAAACQTGVGCLAGGTAFVIGADQAQAGLQGLVTGTHTKTLGAQTLESWGVNPEYSELLYASFDIMSTAKSGFFVLTKPKTGELLTVYISGAGKGGATSVKPHLTAEQQQLIKNAESISTAKPGSQFIHPRDLNEQIVWRQVLEDPSQGKKLIGLNNDPRFPVSAGFQKMEAKHRLPDGKTIEIHYQYNSITGKAYDMKITTPQRVQRNPQDVIESIKDRVK